MLRKATDLDSEFAYQTKKAAFREYVEQVWGWDEDAQRHLHKKRFAAQDFRIIQLSGIDIGILAVVQKSDCLKLNQIYVLPEYQGLGIGTACVRELIEDAARTHIPIRLQVLKVNDRAITFYQRLGFYIIDENETHKMMEKSPKDDGVKS